MRRLEAEYPTIEEAGCKVGIGVATGADQVFIGHFDDLDVEPDRKLPLVMTRDILEGSVKWRGLGVINPFGPMASWCRSRIIRSWQRISNGTGRRSRRGMCRRKTRTDGIARSTGFIPS